MLKLIKTKLRSSMPQICLKGLMKTCEYDININFENVILLLTAKSPYFAKCLDN